MKKELQRILKTESKKFGRVKIMSRIKPFNSVVSKIIERKRFTGFKTLGDLVGGAILFETKEDADKFMGKFRRRHKSAIVDYEEKTRGSDNEYGYYGSHHLDFMVNGIVCEIQIMTKKLWNYKKETHKIYATSRGKEGGPDNFDKHMSKKMFSLGNRKGYVREDYSISEYLQEAAGRDAGKLELLRIDIDTARAHAQKELGKDFDTLKDFDKSFNLARSKAVLGKTKRKDMPRIRQDNIPALKAKLKEDGYKFTNSTASVKDLVPIQRQFYFDHSVEMMSNKGLKGARSYIDSSFLFVSEDNRILDGHHRYLAAMLIDPAYKFKVFKIGIPLDKLLPYLVEFGDNIGNERNK